MSTVKLVSLADPKPLDPSKGGRARLALTGLKLVIDGVEYSTIGTQSFLVYGAAPAKEDSVGTGKPLDAKNMVKAAPDVTNAVKSVKGKTADQSPESLDDKIARAVAAAFAAMAKQG